MPKDLNTYWNEPDGFTQEVLDSSTAGLGMTYLQHGRNRKKFGLDGSARTDGYLHTSVFIKVTIFFMNESVSGHIQNV